mgnify:CR=1 FL=1
MRLCLSYGAGTGIEIVSAIGTIVLLLASLSGESSVVQVSFPLALLSPLQLHHHARLSRHHHARVPPKPAYAPPPRSSPSPLHSPSAVSRMRLGSHRCFSGSLPTRAASQCSSSTVRAVAVRTAMEPRYDAHTIDHSLASSAPSQYHSTAPWLGLHDHSSISNLSTWLPVLIRAPLHEIAMRSP